MQPFVPILIACWLLMMAVLLREVRRLDATIGYLPTATPGETSVSSMAYGQQIRNYLTLPPELEGRPAVLLMASSTCSACHRKLEEFLDIDAQREIDFACYLVSNDEEFDKFDRKYKRTFPYYQFDQERLLRLGIEATPAYVVLNAHGFVEVVHTLTAATIQFYKSEIEKGEINHVQQTFQSTGHHH